MPEKSKVKLNLEGRSIQEKKIRILETYFFSWSRIFDKYQKGPEQIFAEKEVKSLVAKALENLTEQERRIIKWHYGLKDGYDHTLEEIGQRLKLSTERVRQIEMIALRKLVHPAKRLKLGNVIASFQEETEIKRKGVEKIIEFPDDLGIVLVSTDVNEELIQYFSKHPQEMKTMNRGLYEQMIAELFSGFGFEVELTKQTRDGGKDIIAIRHAEVAEKFIIEAKRPDPGNPVGVVPVRALYGVKHRERATKAILATTTYFTRDAKVEFQENIWEIDLKEYADIINWINEYLKIKEDY